MDANNMFTAILSDDEKKELFERVWQMHDRENWNMIDRYMGREYLCDWLDFKASHGELTDRSLVFRSDAEPDFTDETISLDNVIRDKVLSFMSNYQMCDLYDLVSLCSMRFDELSPDIKGLLQTILDLCDERHLDYILATQYDPAIDEKDLREKYALSCANLGLDMTQDPRMLVL